MRTVLLMIMLCLMLRADALMPSVMEPKSILPESVVEDITMALRNAGYDTAALLIPYVKTMIHPPATLLIPSDAAIASADIPSSALVSMARVHILKSNLSFDNLTTLPVGTLIPTSLHDSRVEVMNNSPKKYMINNVEIKDKDLCPRNISKLVTCQGINKVLKMYKRSPPPSTIAPAPAPEVSAQAPSPVSGRVPVPAVVPRSAPSIAPSIAPIRAPAPSPAKPPAPATLLGPSPSPPKTTTPVHAPAPSSHKLLAPAPSPSGAPRVEISNFANILTLIVLTLGVLLSN